MKRFHSIRGTMMERCPSNPNTKGVVLLLKDTVELPFMCLKFLGVGAIDLLIITHSVITSENIIWINKLVRSVQNINQIDLIGKLFVIRDDSKLYYDTPPLTRLGILDNVQKISLKYSIPFQSNLQQNFCSSLPYFHLQSLSLEQIEMDDHFAETLGFTIGNSKLKILSLFLIKSDADYLKPILLGVSRSTIMNLEILCCKSQYSPWKPLAKLLGISASIRNISICSSFPSQNFEWFGSSLKKNKVLTELIIDSSNFRPYQYEVFARSIPINLKSLNFRSSTPPPIHCLVELVSTSHLHSLIFSNEDLIDINLAENYYLTQFGDGFPTSSQIQILSRNKKLHTQNHIKLLQSSRAILMLDLPYELKVEIFQYLCHSSFVSYNVTKDLKPVLLQPTKIGKLDQSTPFDINNLSIQ
ncbi:hypothetical protein HDV06_004563 [Boothiomyces sp. JEL0866]|nr:hypothetical protein HDV06_004563 [Boothiomyces sp. JEL0866]